MRARLLVVEDDPQNMKLARLILEDAGYEVLPASDAEEALATLALEDPDAMLLDIGLPTMDGIALARLLNKDARTANIPLIAVTAFAMRGDRERALAAGFVDHITKPIDRTALLIAIERALRARPIP